MPDSSGIGDGWSGSVSYGLEIRVVDACTDGNQTVLHFETELDPQVWGLTALDFPPTGRVYFETSTILLENGELFSGISGGSRDGPWFDSTENRAKARYTLSHPEAASLSSSFELTAEVTLLDLPSTYRPPAMPLPVQLLEGGILLIPVQLHLPVTMTMCR